MNDQIEKLISKEEKSEDEQVNYYLKKMDSIRVEYDMATERLEAMRRDIEQLERHIYGLDARYDQYRENIGDRLKKIGE